MPLANKVARAIVENGGTVEFPESVEWSDRRVRLARQEHQVTTTPLNAAMILMYRSHTATTPSKS